MIHAKSLKHKKAEELYMSGMGDDGNHFMTASFADIANFQEGNETEEEVTQKVEEAEPYDNSANGDCLEEQDPVDLKPFDSGSNGLLDDSSHYEPSTSKKTSEAEVSIIRVPGRPYHHNIMRAISRKRRLGASDVIEAIEKNDFTGYELLQIVKAAIPKL